MKEQSGVSDVAYSNDDNGVGGEGKLKAISAKAARKI